MKITFKPSIIFALACSAIVVVGLSYGCNKENAPIPGPSKPDPTTPVLTPGEYVLPVIETTDIHGHIIQQEGEAIHYRLAYIADKVMDIRVQNGEYSKDRLLLLDGGDLYQGSSVSNLLSGWPIYASIDMMDYDAVALGNHEFDWGIETILDPDASMLDYQWNGTACENLVPILCSNVYLNDVRFDRTKDYVIVEKQAFNTKGESIKVKIGIIGFAVDYSTSIMSSKFRERGFSIKEDYSIPNSIATRLESSGECDATVLLTHGGADEAAERLGKDSPVDLVLGGHTHRTMTGTANSGVPFIQGGRYAEAYASATFRFNVDKESKISFYTVADKKISPVVNTKDLHTQAGQNTEDLDQTILEVSDKAMEETAEQFNDVIGYITVGATTYYIDGSGGRASTMSNWMCDIQRKIGDADISFVNKGGIRTTLPLNGSSKLDITVANVYDIFPFSNTVYVYDISYADLLELLTYSLTNGGGSLYSCMCGNIDCHYRDYSVVSLVKDGLEIYKNKQWYADWATRRLTLAVSEYLATSSLIDNYTKLENPLIKWNSTSRLISDNQIDNESAVRVLKAEAASSGGHLYIDTKAHILLDE